MLGSVGTGTQPLDAAHMAGVVWVPDSPSGTLYAVDDGTEVVRVDPSGVG